MITIKDKTNDEKFNFRIHWSLIKIIHIEYQKRMSPIMFHISFNKSIQQYNKCMIPLVIVISKINTVFKSKVDAT